jgi:hypothetical protein
MTEIEEKVKRSPWKRAPMPMNPDPNAAEVISLKEQFDLYMENNYKKLPIDERKKIWNKVGLEMLNNSSDKLNQIIENNIKI